MIPKEEIGGGVDAKEKKEKQRRMRRIGLLKRSGLLEAAPGLTVTRAMTADDLAAAYRLVHDVYVDKGYLRRHPTGLRLRVFEASPEMATFTARFHGELIGVTSVMPYTREMGLPSMAGFSEEIEGLRCQGRWPAEITNLAIDPDYHHSGALFALMRAAQAQSFAFGCDDVFIAISPCHTGFFNEVVQFSRFATRRRYCKGSDDIVEGMRMNLRTVAEEYRQTDALLDGDAFLHDYFIAKNPFFRKTARWARDARLRFLDSGLLRELLVRQGRVQDFFGVAEFEALRTQWGDGLLNEVFANIVVTAAEQQERSVELSAVAG